MKPTKEPKCFRCGEPVKVDSVYCYCDKCSKNDDPTTPNWEESIRKFVDDYKYEDGCIDLCFDEPDTFIKNLVNLVRHQISQAEQRGYKKGVADEIKCFETSGEHSEQISKLVQEAEQRGAERERERIKEVLFSKEPEYFPKSYSPKEILSAIATPTQKEKKNENT